MVIDLLRILSRILKLGKQPEPIGASSDNEQEADDRHKGPAAAPLLGEDVAIVLPDSDPALEVPTERRRPAALLQEAGDLLFEGFAFVVVFVGVHVGASPE